jgi:hypothetical protein
MPLMEGKDKKNFKDADGNVKIAPRNVTTSPVKKGKVGPGTTLAGKIEYMPDEYDYRKVLEAKEREYHKSKLQEKDFCPRAKHTDTFNNAKQVYMEDPPIPPKKIKEEAKHIPPGKEGATHDRAFKPSNPGRKGIFGTIDKFPEHSPDPPTEKKRVIKDENAPESPPGFKATYKYKSRPSPSVATNLRNLKASFPGAFRR